MQAKSLASSGPFRYCFDPVCLTAFAAYLANRWFLKPLLGPHISFFHDYFNDVLCIPLFLPPVLYIDRLLGLRPRHQRPTAFELLFHLVIWSICFEVVAPRLPTLFRTTADPFDVAAYALGAGLAGLAWGSWGVKPAARGAIHCSGEDHARRTHDPDCGPAQTPLRPAAL